MARQPRLSLPGFAFHITTRIQGRAHRLTAPVRDRTVRLLATHVTRSDVRLLAFVVMTNHLHLVVVQGERPLGHFMQPFLTSVSRAVQRAHGVEGHVFERRYRRRICFDLAHLRNAIAYTHANPVRAGLCEAPGDYRWSSHAYYATDSSGAPDIPVRRRRTDPPVEVAEGLAAFTDRAGTTAEAARATYLDMLAAVLRPPADDAGNAELPGEATPPAVADSGGALSGPGARTRTPLSAIADACVRRPAELQEIRTRFGPRSRIAARSRFVLAAVRAEYTLLEIARFLNVSVATVSRDLYRSTQLL